MLARISSSDRPRASSEPTWRLRLSVPVHVSTRSPRPLRPDSVSRWPPAAHASRVTSARPRVMSAASALCPSPSPSTTPAAIAMMFFSAPPISTPATSSLPYRRKYGPRNSACTSSVAARFDDAASTAVGSCCATSDAKLGPERTTTGCAPTSCSMTSDIRSSVPPSRPFVALTRTAPLNTCGAAARRTARHPCDGMATTTRSVPSSAVSSECVTLTHAGNVTSGR